MGGGRLAFLGRVPLVPRPVLGTGPLSLTDETFSQVLSAQQAIVDFWSPSCVPCLAWKPTFEEVAADPSVSPLLATLNIEEAPKAVETYSVEAVPTMIFFQNGAEIYRHAGKMEKGAFLSKIAEVFADRVLPQTPIQTALPPALATSPGNAAPWGWILAGGGIMALLLALAVRK